MTLAVLLLALLVVPALAQAQPKFDAASVKPCAANNTLNAGGRGGGGMRGESDSPGRLHITCMTLGDLINIAWVQFAPDQPLINDSGVLFDTMRLHGGPAWSYSTRYSIEAEAEGAPGPEIMQGPMLRAVLTDRFRLKLHRDTEEVALYLLTVAKSGLKLKPAPGGCTPYVLGLRYSDPALAPDGTPWCSTRSRNNGRSWLLDSAGTSLSGVAEMLSRVLSQHVRDETGIPGLFTFHLEFARDEATGGRGGPPPADASPDAAALPSVFTAVEQVGLKLVQGKGPHGILVIDHAEMPSEN